MRILDYFKSRVKRRRRQRAEMERFAAGLDRKAFARRGGPPVELADLSDAGNRRADVIQMGGRA
jgi:hypothetical protein